MLGSQVPFGSDKHRSADKLAAGMSKPSRAPPSLLFGLHVDAKARLLPRDLSLTEGHWPKPLEC